MNDSESLLERQALWQQSRRTLSWPEKIRLAERIRPTVEAFRLQRASRQPDGGADGSLGPPTSDRVDPS